MGQRTWSPEGATFRSISSLAFANEIAKPQVCIISNNTSNECKKNCNRKWKFATGNRN